MFQKVFLKLTRARRFRSGMIALCAIVSIVLVAVGPSSLLALGTVTVRVDPVTRAAPVNGTFTVDIVADVGTEMNPDGLGAYEFDLVYDPNYLEVDSVSDAGGLGSTSRTVSALGPNIDNPNGRTTFAAYSYPPEDVSGPGTTVVLATVTLTGTGAGATTLNLENALLTDTQANAWPDAGAGHALSLESGVLVLDTFGDEVGVWRDGAWYLDYNGNWSWNGPIVDVYSTAFGVATDMPLVGDWNGDGGDEVGVWRNGAWYLDYNGNWSWDGPIVDVYSTAFGVATDTPLVGDWNGRVE